MSGVPLRAVSDLPEGVHREVPVVLSTAEISGLVERFADAAHRLMVLGWDGAEVTSLGGHLIEQFFDPSVNDRTDRYGGSLQNRVRFAREVLTAVREATSDDFILSFRMTADQSIPDGGLTPADLRQIAQAITAGGTVDVLSIANGTGYTERTSSVFVPGDELAININGAHAGLMRRATGVPVLVAGRILDAATAERALTEDGVDFVAMTRALIADPDLPRKTAAGGASRPCISLNEGCIGRLYQGRPMWCSVNPAIREPDLETSPPLEPRGSRRVVVIGGGVAGAEAAYRAAESGNLVTLYEAAGQIGGRARIAGSRRGRERWDLYLDLAGRPTPGHRRRCAPEHGSVGGGHSCPGTRRRHPRDRIDLASTRLGRVGPAAGRGRGSRRRSRPRPTRGRRHGPRRRRRRWVRGPDRRRVAGRRRLEGEDRHRPAARRGAGRPHPGVVRPAPAEAGGRRAHRLRAVGSRRRRGSCRISRPTSAVRWAHSTSSWSPVSVEVSTSSAPTCWPQGPT